MKKILYKTDQKNQAIVEYLTALKKGMKNQHILPWKNKWIVKRADSNKSSKIFISQEDATKYANSIAESQGSAVFIHNNDGTIKERRDF